VHIGFGGHAHEEGDVIDACRQVWQQATHPAATLAVLLKFVRTLEHVARLARRRLDMSAGIELLAVPFDQLGLVIEHVHLARAAVEKNLHDAFDLRAMVQAAVEVRARLGRAGQQTVLAKQVRHGDAAKASSETPEKLAARHRILTKNVHQFTNMNSLLLRRIRHAFASPCCFAYAINSLASWRRGALANASS
jgi:hypothetical protein